MRRALLHPLQSMSSSPWLERHLLSILEIDDAVTSAALFRSMPDGDEALRRCRTPRPLRR